MDHPTILCLVLDFQAIHLSNEINGPWLFRGFVGDEILPSYVGILINILRIHIKQPVEWKVSPGYFRGAFNL